MHLQRLVLPSGKAQTACDGDAAVSEMRTSLSTSTRRYAPRTVSHYAEHVVWLGDYLAALDKGFSAITTADLNRFIPAAAKIGRVRGARTTIIPLRPEHVGLSTSPPSPRTCPGIRARRRWDSWARCQVASQNWSRDLNPAADAPS